MVEQARITAAIWTWGTETREQMETAAREVSQIGYKSFESIKSAIHAFDMDLEAYRDVLQRYDLTPVSFYYHLPSAGEESTLFETLESELEFIAALGVKRLCLQATGGRPENMDEENMRYELELIIKFARITKEFGITTNLHPHHNTWVMYEKEIDYMMQNSDPALVSFAPDTAHLVAGGCDPVEMVRRYLDRVNFTHFKDIKDANVESAGLAKAGMEVYKNFCELGTGCVDFRQIFDLLKGAGYDGPLCEELDIAPVSNAKSAKHNYDYLFNNY